MCRSLRYCGLEASDGVMHISQVSEDEDYVKHGIVQHLGNFCDIEKRHFNRRRVVKRLSFGEWSSCIRLGPTAGVSESLRQ